MAENQIENETSGINFYFFLIKIRTNSSKARQSKAKPSEMRIEQSKSTFCGNRSGIFIETHWKMIRSVTII